MATKAKKTTRTPRSKSTATPKKATVGSATSAPATPAIEAAVKKAVATPSRTTGRASAAQSSDSADTRPAPVSGVTRPVQSHVNKKEFVGRVAKRADLRPNQVREITEAVLSELGKALSHGDELKLPGLGKVQVKRKKDVNAAEVMVCKVRRKKDEDSDTDPLAPATE